MQAIARKFWDVEGPTWILAVAICGAWFLLMWFQAYIPWWAMIFLGGYVIAWQFSLQHETIHGFRGVPKWFRTLIAMLHPGFSLGLLRAFIEHRAGPRPGRRVASVESNTLFGLLFLYNNLHVAHHLRPTIPWYELPRFYRENRAKLLKHNDNFVFRGYWEITRQYLFRPVFVPVHPTV
jgi:fatty acid desaturase